MDNSRLYITLFILWLGHFLVDFMIGVWPVYKTMAQLDLAKAGLLTGFCALIGESMQVISGPLGDRGHRKFLILGGVFMAAGGCFYAFTQNFSILFILMVCTYIGSGAFHPSAVGLIGSLKSTRKGLLIGIFGTGGSLGLACSQMIFSSTYHSFSGNTMILVLPIIMLVSFCAFYKFTGVQKAADVNMSKKIDFSAYLQCFKNPCIALLFISQVCNQTLVWGFNFLLPDVLLSRGYDHWLVYGGAHFCFIIGGACMMIPAGYLADKYSFRSVLLIATGLGIVTFYTFILGTGYSSAAIMGILFCLGGSLLSVMPVSVAFGNRLMPGNPGVVSALLMGIVWCISESVGPAGGGLLTKVFNEDAPAKVLMCMGLFQLVGIAMIYKLAIEKKAVEKLEVLETSF